MRFELNNSWAPWFFDILGYTARILCLGGESNFKNTDWRKENYLLDYKPSITDVREKKPYDAIWFIKDDDSYGPEDLLAFVKDALVFLKQHGIFCIMIPCRIEKEETTENARKRYLQPLCKEGLTAYQYGSFIDQKRKKQWLVLLLARAESMEVTNTDWSRTSMTYAIAYYNTAERTCPTVGEVSQRKTITVPAARFTAAVVNMAFACELGLKGLLGEAPIEHNLEKLYRMLPVGERLNLYQLVMEKLIGREPQFSELLHVSCENFVEWRYIFVPEEDNNKLQGPYYYLKAFSEALVKSIGMEDELEGYQLPIADT